MKYSQYKFKFYVNANHAIYLKGTLGQKHPHTWEIVIDTIKVKDDFVQFDYIEKSVEKFFSVFQDADINTIKPFTYINPTLENLTDYFKERLAHLLGNSGWLLSKIEVSETPSRSYIIDRSDEIDELIKKEIQSASVESFLEVESERKVLQMLGEFK